MFSRGGRQGALLGYLALSLVAGFALVWLGARMGGWLRG
jgi:hypothetical protein